MADTVSATIRLHRKQHRLWNAAGIIMRFRQILRAEFSKMYGDRFPAKPAIELSVAEDVAHTVTIEVHLPYEGDIEANRGLYEDRLTQDVAKLMTLRPQDVQVTISLGERSW